MCRGDGNPNPPADGHIPARRSSEDVRRRTVVHLEEYNDTVPCCPVHSNLLAYLCLQPQAIERVGIRIGM